MRNWNEDVSGAVHEQYRTTDSANFCRIAESVDSFLS